MSNFKPGYVWRLWAKNPASKSQKIIKYTHSNYAYPSYFDELTIDKWFRIKKKNKNLYIINIEGYKIDVKFNGEEKPKVCIDKE